MQRCRGKQLFHWAERRINNADLSDPASEKAREDVDPQVACCGSHVIALGAIFAQRDGDFMGARH
jgi:hypothetical protein